MENRTGMNETTSKKIARLSVKVGDLVELSAYANKLKMFKVQRGKVGLIEEAEYDHYRVQWHGEAGWPRTHRRIDLRRVK